MYRNLYETLGRTQVELLHEPQADPQSKGGPR